MFFQLPCDVDDAMGSRCRRPLDAAAERDKTVGNVQIPPAGAILSKMIDWIFSDAPRNKSSSNY